MANKNISQCLVLYFREMKNHATSHDKIAMLLSICIWIGCSLSAYKDLAISMQSLKFVVFAGAVIIIILLWLTGFSLGVIFRGPHWEPVFPPYGLIGMATVPSFLIGVVFGSLAGVILFNTSLQTCTGISFRSGVVVLIVTHILFLLHTPLTRAAVRSTHNINIKTVDSHRYMWLFPALSVLALFWVTKYLAPAESEMSRHISTTAAIVLSVTMTSFGAGYIP